MDIDNSQKTVNTVVVLTSILLMSVSIYQLFFHHGQTSHNKNSIGKITWKGEDVRLKKSSQFEWTPIPIGRNTSVSENDRVFSNKSSTAQVKLNTGHQVNIEETSLVKITDESTIKIKSGKATIEIKKGGKPLNLHLGEKVFKIFPKKSGKIEVENNINKSFKVTKGELALQHENESINLKSNEKLVLSSQNTFSKTLLLSPVETTYYTQLDKQLIEFKYDGEADSAILLSNNFNLTKLIPVVNNFIELSPGEYFWRIKDSDLARFTIFKKIAPPHILGGLKQSIFFYGKTTDLSLEIESSQGEVQAILLNEKLNILAEKIFKPKSIQFKNLSSGIYYIQLKHHEDFITSDWSPSFQVELVKKPIPQTESLVIELKKPNQKVKFEWNKKPGDLSLFEVSKDKDFKEIIIDKRIRSKNFTHVSFPVIGTFYWRSRKLNPDGRTEFQAPIKVIVKPTPPPKKPKKLPPIKLKIKSQVPKQSSFWRKLFSLFIPMAHASEDSNQSISFPAIENAKTYEVEIYDINQKLLIFKSTVKKPFLTWTPPKTGTFKWRIRYQDYWGRYSEFSDFSTITVTKEKLKPKSKKVIKVVEKKKTTLNKTISEPIRNKEVSVAIGVSSIQHTQDGDEKISIEGESFDSKEVQLHLPFKSNFFTYFHGVYKGFGGKVFDDLDYRIRELQISLGTNFYYLAPSVRLKQVSSFKAEDNEITSDGNISAPSLGFEFRRAYNVGKNHVFTPNLLIYALGAPELQISVSYEYQGFFEKKFYISPKYYSGSFSGGDIDFSTQLFQLVIGISYLF